MKSEKILKLKKYIEKENIDAILISSVANIEYLTGFMNFSKEERDAYLLITKDKNYLITNSLFAQAFKGKKWDFTLAEISAKSRSKEIFTKIKQKSKIKSLAIEEYDLKVNEYKNLKKIFPSLVKFDFPDFRSTKTKEEIRLIYKACQIGDKVFEEVIKKIKAGLSEREISQEIKLLALKFGADDLSFNSIVAFNENSAVPHHQISDQKLKSKNGQIILMDFGMKVDGYCSDMTRTVFLGKPTGQQKKIYQAVLKSQRLAVDHVKKFLSNKKTAKAFEVDKISRAYIEVVGYESIPHSVGHGIGLEVHEYPHIGPGVESDLTEGMVFSIEPGIYKPKVGGVRIEDLYVIEGNKLRQLTKASKNLIEL